MKSEIQRFIFNWCVTFLDGPSMYRLTIRDLAKSIMFILLGIAALTYSARANANNLATIPNAAGGEIILTDLTSSNCDSGTHIALSRSGDGTLISGCWVLSAPYVWVLWTDSGTVKVFKADDFTPVRQAASGKELGA